MQVVTPVKWRGSCDHRRSVHHRSPAGGRCDARMQGRRTGPVLCSGPLPAALLAEARKHREAIAAALNANAHEPPAAGDVVSSWGLTAEERRAALARLRPQRSQAIAAVVTSGALLAAPQDGSLGPLPPAAAPALLAYIRDRLRCRVTLVRNLVMIAPTWRCPPRVVEAAQRVAPQLRDLLQTNIAMTERDQLTLTLRARCIGTEPVPAC